MTIETPSASPSAKVNAKAEISGGKGASGAAKLKAAAANPFLAILAEMEDGPVIAPQDGISASANPVLMLPDVAPVSGPLVQELVSEPKDDSNSSGAALLAQSNQWIPQNFASEGVKEAKVGDGFNVVGPRAQLASATFCGNPDGLAQDEGGESLRVVATNSKMDAQRKSVKAIVDAAINQSDMKSSTAAHFEFDAKTTIGNATSMKEMSASLTSTVVAPTIVLAAVPINREEHGIFDRSEFKMQVSESFSLPTGVSSNSLILNALPIATADVVAGENYLAEKVAYWISSDIQNAEMKLDGFGNDLVEVSISMQGNEAHVAFRTDETQARMALENASTHLKELLQREGLVLSGVSVGASGAGDSHAQERRSSRQVPKHALVALALEARGNGGRDLAHLTGRSLDLFV